jgi:hypothetical protein
MLICGELPLQGVTTDVWCAMSATRITQTIFSKLSSACFAMRSIKPLIFQQMLKAIYCGDIHMSFHFLFNPVSPHSSPSCIKMATLTA